MGPEKEVAGDVMVGVQTGWEERGGRRWAGVPQGWARFLCRSWSWTDAEKTELMLRAPLSPQTLQGSGHKAGRLAAAFMSPKLQGGGS